ncbi:peroxiredoxin [Jannaschia sp. 2305UL9-9]|uniref:peroxiredoxin n=1 Tax=Jannaschia sp. 2305UL9-9 TaxID=3121638 RepID=UPI003529AF94
MAISPGDTLPDAQLLRMGENGPESVSLSDLTAGKTVAIFALPGAYTGTCTTAHVPSFIRTKSDFAAKGVETVICVSVNDPFVMQAWGDSTGATEAGIHMLGDADGSFTKAMGMDFTAPPVGFHGRSKRYAMIVDNGTVKTLHAEESPGVCETSGGEALLATL